MVGAPAPSRNLLLAALPPDEQERILGALDVVPAALRQVLHRPGDAIEHVYFPGGGFISVVTSLEAGFMVEVATIGREGVVGVDAEVGPLTRSFAGAMVQGACDVCYRMPAHRFRAEMDLAGAFAQSVRRYTHVLTALAMQSTACNAVHHMEQRFARWLLMAQDRMESDSFPLTQEFAAMMLGASRPTVTVVAGTLQRAGLIKYHRGDLTVLDRSALESA